MAHGAPDPRGTCTQCQAEIPEDATYCSQCGALAPKKKTTLKRALAPQPEGPTSTATADPLIGATVAERYVIQSMIGRGGMGVVYKVEHAKIGKIMALKLLTGALARNPETVSRFKREAMMVSKLSHPNTVQVFDYGSAGGLTYLAMEYLSGQDLGELVDRQGPQSFPTMAKIILQVCGAFKEAHDVGMVHRDIKPENLFLTRTPSGDELVKVLDFGLAKLRQTPELGNITTSGNIVGTPFYMAPEQVRGENVDHRADIYALCALLYTCMTGAYVFDAPTPVGVLTAQLSKSPEPPHERFPELGIDPGVSDLVLKGLEKDPADRYQSMDEFEEALRNQLRGQSQVSLHLPHSGYFRKQTEEEAATRDEVEKYERSLERRGRLARAGLFIIAAGVLYGGYRLYSSSTGTRAFDGREVEPNHSVADATPVPFGTPVDGRLGRRISEDRGDQDNYAVTIPESDGQRTGASLNVTALPNMAICAFLFQKGVQQPLHQYCAGAPGLPIDVPQMELRPGKYLVAIKQDLSVYSEGQPVYIHENVSDDYTLKLAPAKFASDFEVEPNEEERGAEMLELGGVTKVEGRLNTMRDTDTVCARGSGLAKFIVRDAEGGARPIHAALRVTPLGGPVDKIPVRVHGSRPTIEVSERDQKSPWESPPTDLSSSPCVQLELVPNPWAPTPHPLTPPASNQLWSVEIVSTESVEDAADESE